jgi:hypothetical protein
MNLPHRGNSINNNDKNTQPPFNRPPPPPNGPPPRSYRPCPRDQVPDSNHLNEDESRMLARMIDSIQRSRARELQNTFYKATGRTISLDVLDQRYYAALAARRGPR